MSNFYPNKEQSEYLKYLAEIPREKRCKCGWYLKHDCPHCIEEKNNMEINVNSEFNSENKTLDVLIEIPLDIFLNKEK